MRYAATTWSPKESLDQEAMSSGMWHAKVTLSQEAMVG